MLSLVRLFCLLLSLCWPSFAAAERELHVVSVANGTRNLSDLMSVHEAHVHVARPGQSILLVLINREPLTWRITLGPDTELEDIWLGGDAPNRSDVFLRDIPVDPTKITGLPVTLLSVGAPFRRLVGELADRTGMDRLTEFYGAYDAPRDGIVIDRAETRPDLRAEYLSGRVGPLGDLPVAIAGWVPRAAPAPNARFYDSGLEVDLPNGAVRFDAPADVPALRFPTDAVYDDVNGVFYGMTRGGIGHVFRVDTATGAWGVIRDQDNFDGARMLLDRAASRLIMTGAFSRPGEIRVLYLDGHAEEFTMPVLRFAGLTDLYDYGDEDPPNLVPHLVEENWVVLSAGNPEHGAFRTYAVNLETQDIRLLAFRGQF